MKTRIRINLIKLTSFRFNRKTRIQFPPQAHQPRNVRRSKFYPQGKGSTKSYLDVLDKIKLPGCAIVAVPDHLHYEVTSACLEKGLHTLVVKPLTPTVV